MPPSIADDEGARRSLVPGPASRSLPLAAVWTGLGTAAVAVVVAVAAVAVLWLPTAGTTANARSALRAGTLTFLAAVHGGITVDGLHAQFVPLAMTLAIVALAWRAGLALLDTAEALGRDSARGLAAAVVVQAAAFAAVCAVLAHVSALGTSHVDAVPAALMGLVLFGCSSGAALVRWSRPGEAARERLPSWARPAMTAAVAVNAVYLLGGALLMGASLAVHHETVQRYSAALGDGWSGVPVLVLGALAAPNAALVASSYLSGPGFAVGSGNRVSLWSGSHGAVPGFPVLGGLPSGAAGATVWTLVVCTLVAAAGCTAVVVSRDRPPVAEAAARLAGAGVLTAVVAAIAAWQAGGAIGDGRLAAVGASPWQAGIAMAGVTLVGGTLGVAATGVASRLRGRGVTPQPIRTLAERVDAAAEVLPTGRTVVEVEEAPRGLLRGTLSSVALAVTVTEDERAALRRSRDGSGDGQTGGSDTGDGPQLGKKAG